MTIVASGSVAGFFREIVEDAIKSQGVDSSDGTTSYVVSLLADYAKPDPQAEAALDGNAARKSTFEKAARALQEALDPPGDLHAPAAYRRSLAGTLLERALERTL